MAFYARKSLASSGLLAHNLSRRLHPSLSHLLPSHSHDDFREPTNPSPSLPLPLPATFPSRLPEPSRTLLLPFGLHLAGHRSFSSSSGEIDVGDVLTDAAAAASAAPPAPFPGEVAAAAADSFLPVAALQHFIDAVHSFTGLNWWACIALTTLLIRTATVPLMLNQMRASVKLSVLRPELEAIKAEIDRSRDPETMKEGQKRMNALFRKHGVTPFTPLKGMFIQGPVFMSFFFAISNMVEKVPSLKGGGALWFTDLTTPDTLYIFPVLTSLTFLATVEFNMQEGMEGNPMAGTMKKFSRGMAVLTIPFTMNFPKAIFCYWVTSNVFSLIYGFVIRKPAVRKLLNLPDIAPQPTPAAQPTFNFVGGPRAISAGDSTLTVKGSENSSSSSGVSSRIRNLEKRAKSRGRSRRHR